MSDKILGIIIGFSYINGLPEKAIPSVIIDIHRAYKFMKDITNIPSDSILILTDMDKQILPPGISEWVAEGIVDLDIMDFMTTEPKYHAIVSYEEIIDNITLKLSEKKYTKIILYYSGHGSNGKLDLPNKSHISIQKIRELFLFNSYYYSEKGSEPDNGISMISDSILQNYRDVFIILDCCNGSDLDLPFYLDIPSKRFKLASNYHLRSRLVDNLKSFIDKRVLLIVSSQQHENAVSTYKGSLFTRLFFNRLYLMVKSSKERSLVNLITELNKEIKSRLSKEYIQTASIHSSYPFLPVIPSWILNPSFNCYIHDKSDSIIIEIE